MSEYEYINGQMVWYRYEVSFRYVENGEEVFNLEYPYISDSKAIAYAQELLDTMNKSTTIVDGRIFVEVPVGERPGRSLFKHTYDYRPDRDGDATIEVTDLAVIGQLK